MTASELLATAALGIAAAGVLCLALVLSRRVEWREGVPMAVELWTGAGLLRLAGDPDWPQIALAAAIILVRQLINRGMHAAQLRRA